METLKFKGMEIIDWKQMKQTNRIRLVIELTEDDSNLYSGVTAMACQQHLIFNGEFVPTEIQGNNNGEEKMAISEIQKVEEKKGETLYQRFKRICVEYSGEDYYKRVKQHLGVEHLKELETKMDGMWILGLFDYQIRFLQAKMRNFDIRELMREFNQEACIDSTDEALVTGWHKTFDDFNKIKEEK